MARCCGGTGSARASRHRRLQQQSGRRGAPVAQGGLRVRSRGSVHRPEHFMTDTADLADYVLPATTQLEHLDVHASYGHTYALINERAIEHGEKPGPTRRSFASWQRAWAQDDACFADDDEALARGAFTAVVPSEQLRAKAGSSCRSPTHRSPREASRPPAAPLHDQFDQARHGRPRCRTMSRW